MSTDLEQFYEIFFEESSELLADMEACLLRLDVNSPDLEDLNAIFRAAHSIKGGAGTFGFTDMTEMTHMLETLLDRLRKGELAVRSEMVDAFLRAGDVIKAQLAGHRGEGEADPAVAAEVCEELKRLSDETQDRIPAEAIADASFKMNTATVEADIGNVPEVTVNVPQPKDDSPKQIYCIEFSSAGMSDAAIENLLTNLKRLGDLEEPSSADKSDRFKLRLSTDSSEEDVWETLAFVVDPANLKIEAETNLIAETAGPEENFSSDVNSAADRFEEDELSMAELPPAPGYGFFPGAPAAPKELDGSESQSSSVQQQNAQSSKNEVQSTVNKPSNKAGSATAASTNETSSIRVSIEKVDQMINLVGELVIGGVNNFV